MNETLKTLLERRSVRGYKEDLVPAEVLDQILDHSYNLAVYFKKRCLHQIEQILVTLINIRVGKPASL